MSDLSPVSTDKLAALMDELIEMRRSGSKDRAKPHKLIMLLAVLDLADQGLLTSNRIDFSEELLRNFDREFDAFADSSDWRQPGPPFFHLRSASFWHHRVKPGRESVYANLSTSGGGVGRILGNIDYAYLSSDAYTIVTDPGQRKILRQFIQRQVKVNPRSLKTVFHESFSLNRDALVQVLTAFRNTPVESNVTNLAHRERILRDSTQLGTRYVKAMPNYAIGAGLLDPEYCLTLFGSNALTGDPLLEKLGTLWLMHYHLSAPNGPGPAFWHDLVTTRFRPGDEFPGQEIAEQIAEFVQREEGKRLAARSTRSTATIFLGTYTKAEGLGKLGILKEIERGRYRVLEPDPPPIWAVALALLDYWEAHYQGLETANLEDLFQERGFANVFMLGRGRLNLILGRIQAEGYLNIYRVAPPYQIAWLRQDRQSLLEALYAVG